MVSKVTEVLKIKGNGPRHRKKIRGLKTNACFFIAIGLIVSGIFFYVWPRMMLMTLTYDYDKLRIKKNELIHLNRMLKLELESIKSLDKVERVAIEKMGLMETEDKNIILVKVEN